ncbi:MAG: nucleotidyl transferase AbiEii/AbiGii toxin family protein [Pseudomonadota bacterium]
MFKKLLKKMALELDRRGIPYMVIGGQAVLLYGEPRLTRDIDITLGITTERLDQILEMIDAIQLKPLVEPHDFTLQTMVLPCRNHENDIRVDFIFSFSPYEHQAMKRVRPVEIAGAAVKFASAEDLVIHKVFAGRPRDMEDVRGVLIKNPEMDLSYIRYWLNELSKTTAEPFLDRFEDILKGAR